MTPNALVRALENNSRQADQRRLEAEQALYAHSEQESRLEHQISSTLGEIASLQLSQDPERDQQTAQLLEQRERAQAALRQELEALEQLIAGRLERHRQLAQASDSQRARMHEQAQQDPALRQCQAQLDAAAQAEQDAHAGYDEIRAECARKLQAYQSNPIYRFLKVRHYGTEQYRPFPLLQRPMDNYLAKLVNFRTNQANEQILLAMQARNETQRQTLSEARAQLQAQYQQQLERFAENADLQALTLEQQAIDAQLAEAKANASSLQVQLSDFAQGRDRHLQQIRQNRIEQLRARPLAELIVEAARTPSAQDDVLVADLQLLHARLRELQQQQRGLQEHANEQRRSFDHAKTLEYALRDGHFSDPRHEYTLRQPIEQILADYMRGVLDQAAVEQLLNEGREYVAPRHRGYGSPSSTYTSGGFARSSGGSGFKTSSSSGGGGFRTTNSF